MNVQYIAPKCLYTASDWGNDRVYNLCDGTMTNIPWGAPDWASWMSLAVVGGLLIAIMSAAAFAAIRAATRKWYN